MCVRACRREQDSAAGRALPRRGVDGEICPAAALALAVRQVRLGEAEEQGAKREWSRWQGDGCYI